MSNKSAPVAYRTCCDIFRHHGCIVLSLYWLTEVASWLSLGHWLRHLPRPLNITRALDTDPDKVRPWWQDAVFALYLLLTFIAVKISWHPSTCIACLGSWLAVYVLYDAVIYHVRVLWFDDIKLSIHDSRRGVWSHRRITFLAIFGYAQMIILFPSIYRLDPTFASASKSSLFERSFSTATSLSMADPSTIIDKTLVVLTLFFIAIVIATTASVAYKRREFAPKLLDP